MTKYVLIVFLLAGTVFAADEKPADSAAQTAEKATVSEKPPRVRNGYIVKAVFTSKKPASEGESRIRKKSSPAWAVVTLELDPGRAISVFDYVLRRNGTEYPCLDLADGEAPFTGKLRNYSSVDGKQCRLAFAIPSATDNYELVFKLAEDSEAPVKLNAKSSSFLSLLR